MNGSAVRAVSETVPGTGLGSRLVVRVMRRSDELLGHLVIDSTIRGRSCGGIRMSEEVSETEVAELARTMTLKYGFAGVKMGGAKAGVVAAPRISPEEKQDRLFSFGAILKPLLQARCYVPAADLGTSSEEILHRKGIVSIPDFVANCGGVLAFLVDAREERFAREFLLERVGDKVARLLREAGSKGLSVRVCASKTAEENSMRMKQRAEQEGERPLKRLFLCVLEIYPDPRLARVPLRLLKAWYARKTCR